MEEELMKAFEDFQIVLERDSPLLDRLRDLAYQHGLSAEELSEHWMAHAANGSRELTEESCDEWGSKLSVLGGDKGRSGGRRREQQQVVERRIKHELTDLYEEDLIGQYGALENGRSPRGVKRSSDETTPPSSSNHKMRVTENGATPTTPLSRRQESINHASTIRPNGVTPATPSNGGSYSQRKQSGAIACRLNDRDIPSLSQRGKRREVKVHHYDNSVAITKHYHHGFQKISDKAIALLEWAEELGGAICHHHSLPEPLPLSQPSLEPAVYVGRIVCDGEGHINSSSVLLEGGIKPGTPVSHRVQLELSPSTPCSLFPGQVVAVEGVNNFAGTLISNITYDMGVCPPLPSRSQNTVGGFTAMVATGPFSTTDTLDMTPLHDLLTTVSQENPDILILMGPFVDINNSVVKTGRLPDDQTLDEYFTHSILTPLLDCARSHRVQLLLIPSQRDAHHPFEVFPQPPFHTSIPQLDRGRVHLLSDPCTLSVNGVCIGMTSTDILFHLSARTMFLGPGGDRMARLASHILRQQSYYPLTPPYRKEEPHPLVKTENDDVILRPPHEACDINLDYVQAFEERGACLPARPDILLLPSDLKPFVKVVDGCVCINPGHLTRKMTGGTFLKLFVPELPAKPDLTSDLSATVIHI